MMKTLHLNAKGQGLITGMITIIIAAIVVAVMLAPVTTIIDASVSAGNFSAETKALLYLIPTVIIAALIAGFFVLSSGRGQQYSGV